jgi:tripartite ATP-independent transporter DctP family solute receptor
MRRRDTLLTAAAAVLSLANRPARAEPARTLKLGFILSMDSQLGAGAKVFAEQVAARTDGRYKIELYPDAELGGEVDMLKAVQIGSVDLAFVTGAPLPNFVPEVGVFNIPFLFRDAAHAHAALDGPVGQACLEKLRGKDLVALAWGENGMRQLTNSRRPVRVPDDLRGLKLRLPQSEVMMLGFRTLGAEVGPLAFPALFDALRTGEFDGQENPIATIQSARFFQVQKHLTISNHVYDPAVIVLSPDAHDDLSEADAKVFSDVARLAGAASRTFSADAQAKGADALAKAGMALVPSIDRDLFLAAMAPAKHSYEQMFGAELIRSVQATA